jgi:carbon-monoxide dehydrogenase small subunit
MVMSVIDLLRREPRPDDQAIRHGLEGNLCRCTGYENIVKSVRLAAERLRA